MDRDVLLWLLVGAVLLNTALLVLVALVRATGASHASSTPAWAPVAERQPESGHSASPVLIGHLPVAPSPIAPGSIGRSAQQERPARLSAAPLPAAPLLAAPLLAAPLPATARVPAAPLLAAPHPAAAPGAAPAPARALATLPAAPPPEPAPEPAPESPARNEVPTLARPDPVPSIPEPAARTATRTAAPTATRTAARRPRRFTMPDLDEDHDRAARSIAAFLGEPVAHSAGERVPGRRHRARRPSGTTHRTDVILVLSGETRGVRLGHAVAVALRDTIRESDEVIELPGNRVRVTLDVDETGRDAFVARARSVVRPWLDVVGPALELHVEGSRELESASA